MIVTRVGFGEDSHAFVRDLVSLQAEHNVSVLSADYITLAGAKINTPFKLQANSDGDVVLHAVCRALQTLSGREVLGEIADKRVQAGHFDSAYFVNLALQDLYAQTSTVYRCWRNLYISQIALQIEAAAPKLSPYYAEMKSNIVRIFNSSPVTTEYPLTVEQVGISAMSGEGLTAVGSGKGIAVRALVTVCTEIEM